MAFVCGFVIYDTPQENPRVSKDELIYISTNIIQDEDGSIVSKFPPFWAMMKSIKVWAMVRLNIDNRSELSNMLKNCRPFNYLLNSGTRILNWHENHIEISATVCCSIL